MDQNVERPEDQWSAENVVFHHVWPLWAAAAGGAGYALVWLLAGHPDVHLRGWFFPVGAALGGLAALVGPPARRWPRLMLGAGIGWLASASAAVVAIVGLRLGGGTDKLAIGALVTNVFVLVFFGGCFLLMVSATRPRRRLSDSVLAQIPPPVATRRKPRKVKVRCQDGTTHTINVIQGGFVALRSPVEATDVVAIVPG